MTNEISEETIAESALSLQPIIDNTEPATPLLPLTHSTGAVNFFEIIGCGSILASNCKIYEEELLYLFYGRPAYRPESKILSTSDEGFRPVSILLHPDIETSIARVVPIDTGAFSKGLFDSHCPKAIRKEHFEINSGVDAASRHVQAFFGDNESYYLSRLRKNLSLESTQLVAKAYTSIQSNSGQTKTDDRRSTIEVHVSADIPLSKATVMAVALPKSFLENDQLRALIVDKWQADVIKYDIYHDRPVHDVREIMSKVKDYLVQKSFM